VHCNHCCHQHSITLDFYGKMNVFRFRSSFHTQNFSINSVRKLHRNARKIDPRVSAVRTKHRSKLSERPLHYFVSVHLFNRDLKRHRSTSAGQMTAAVQPMSPYFRGTVLPRRRTRSFYTRRHRRFTFWDVAVILNDNSNKLPHICHKKHKIEKNNAVP
jgi:hypothetical protein